MWLCYKIGRFIFNVFEVLPKTKPNWLNFWFQKWVIFWWTLVFNLFNFLVLLTAESTCYSDDQNVMMYDFKQKMLHSVKSAFITTLLEIRNSNIMLNIESRYLWYLIFSQWLLQFISLLCMKTNCLGNCILSYFHIRNIWF